MAACTSVKILGLVAAVTVVLIYVFAFGKQEGATGGHKSACNASNRCWEVNASGVSNSAPLRYLYDCGIKQPVSLSLTSSQNTELFNLNPHIKNFWDQLPESKRVNKMFGSAHGGTWEHVTLPPKLSACGAGPDDITWIPPPTNGGKPGYMVLNTAPLSCNKDCCKAISEYAKDGYFLPMTTIGDRVLWTILGQKGCPPHDSNTIQLRRT